MMRRNLTQELVHDLGSAIVRGDYVVDGSFPSEAAIGKNFDVGRSATREAVKMLAAKGLIHSTPKKGIRVLPESQWNLFDPDVLGWLLDARPSRTLLLEFAQMRIGIEPEAAALAAKYGTTEAIAKIEAAHQRMVAAAEGRDDPLSSDIEFHIAILRAGGNRFYAHMSTFVETALRVSIRFTNATKGVRGPDVKAHGDILGAIKKKNADQAYRQVRKLLLETIDLIVAASKRQEVA